MRGGGSESGSGGGGGGSGEALRLWCWLARWWVTLWRWWLYWSWRAAARAGGRVELGATGRCAVVGEGGRGEGKRGCEWARVSMWGGVPGGRPGGPRRSGEVDVPEPRGWAHWAHQLRASRPVRSRLAASVAAAVGRARVLCCRGQVALVQRPRRWNRAQSFSTSKPRLVHTSAKEESAAWSI